MIRSIIIEGPDGAGKTTLAKKLADRLGATLRESDGPPKSRIEFQIVVDECFKMHTTERLVVFDRHSLISNTVYRTALGKELFRSPIDCRIGLIDLNPIIVYCRYPDIDEMFNRMIKTGKEHKPPEYVQLVKENYIRIVNTYDIMFSGLDHVVYDQVKMTTNKIIDHVIEELGVEFMFDFRESI